MSRILLLLDCDRKDRLALHLGTEYEVLLANEAPNMMATEEEGQNLSVGRGSRGELLPIPNSQLSTAISPSPQSAIPDAPFDLCLLDEAALARFWSLLQGRKAVEEPVFLPMLLVTESLGSDGVTGCDRAGEPTPASITLEQLRQKVDDVIVSPVAPVELLLRIEGLLARRHLSLEVSKLKALFKESTLSRDETTNSEKISSSQLQIPNLKLYLTHPPIKESSYLDSLINAMPDIVCFKDGEGRWLEANQAMLELFELDEADYRGLKDRELGELSNFYLEALVICEGSDREAWTKKVLSRGEEVIPRSDGTVKIYDVIKVPLFYPSGERKAIVILGRDITERKQAEDELVRLASIVESTDDAIIGKTPEGIIQSWNAGAEQIYGYTAAEVKGLPISILALPDHLQEMPQILASIRLGTGIDHYETVHLRKDGKQIDVSLTISPIKDAAGAVVGVSTIARDISDRKRVEMALEQLRHQHELILHSAGEGICGLNRYGKITFVNPAAAKMTGYEVKELIDQSLHQRLNHSQVDQLPNHSKNSQIFATLEDGLARHVTDEVFWRRDGTSFPVEYVATPICDRQEIIGAVVTFKDITDRLAVEKMKDEFISVVSHELRTPLTSIHGALRLLASGLLDPQSQRGQRMLEIAVTNTDRLVRLINDILDLERMQSRYSNMERQTCNAAELMVQAVDEMRAMAEKAEVTLSVQPIAALVRAVPDRLIQALTNLLSNAIKFSPQGATIWFTGEVRAIAKDPASTDLSSLTTSVTVTEKVCSGEKQAIAPHSITLNEATSANLSREQINLSPYPEPHWEVLIAVTDRGRGIPGDKLETIFERFQQVDTSDSRQKGGTGLGLAICRSIVEQHGGKLWAESILGEGSTFFLTLPVVTDGGYPTEDSTPLQQFSIG